MMISEVIAALMAIQDEHGDLHVERGDGFLAQAVEPIRTEADEDGDVIAVRVS